jgi:hypothetical protein
MAGEAVLDVWGRAGFADGVDGAIGLDVVVDAGLSVGLGVAVGEAGLGACGLGGVVDAGLLVASRAGVFGAEESFFTSRLTSCFSAMTHSFQIRCDARWGGESGFSLDIWSNRRASSRGWSAPR